MVTGTIRRHRPCKDRALPTELTTRDLVREAGHDPAWVSPRWFKHRMSSKFHHSRVLVPPARYDLARLAALILEISASANSAIGA